jgi:hypothetical protein
LKKILLQVTVEPLYEGNEKIIRHQHFRRIQMHHHDPDGNFIWGNNALICFGHDPADQERFKAKKTGTYLSFLSFHT